MELAKPAFPALPQAKEDSEVSGSCGPGPPAHARPAAPPGLPLTALPAPRCLPRPFLAAGLPLASGAGRGSVSRPLLLTPPATTERILPPLLLPGSAPSLALAEPRLSAVSAPRCLRPGSLHYPRLLRALSNTALSASRDGAAAASPGGLATLTFRERSPPAPSPLAVAHPWRPPLFFSVLFCAFGVSQPVCSPCVSLCLCKALSRVRVRAFPAGNTCVSLPSLPAPRSRTGDPAESMARNFPGVAEPGAPCGRGQVAMFARAELLGV